MQSLDAQTLLHHPLYAVRLALSMYMISAFIAAEIAAQYTLEIPARLFCGCITRQLNASSDPAHFEFIRVYLAVLIRAGR